MSFLEVEEGDIFIDLVVSDGQCYAIYYSKYTGYKWIPQDG